jgi:glycosyltransferase involved in cell wall biosynthesis
MNKKVVWLQDIDPFVSNTGGELNDKAKIIAGIRRGYDIEVVTPHNFSQKIIDSADLIVLSNTSMFTQEQLKFTKPYVIYHHDYMYVCKWRLYFSEEERCKSCVEWRRNLIRGASLNLFLSPLHRQAHQAVVPEIGLSNSVCIPSSVDTEHFKPITPTERNGVLYVGVIDEFKGISNVLLYASERGLKVDFYGYDQNNVLCDRIETEGHKIIGPVDYFNLPELYSKYEYAIHLPQQSEPYGRFLVEAYLCGCKIITNQNNGAWSYPFMKGNNKEEIRHTLSYSSIAFWEEIESKVFKDGKC